MRQATENNSPSILNRETKVGWHQHLKRKIMSRPRDKIPTGDHRSLMWATIGGHAGRHSYLQGKYEEAEAMHRHALRDREKVLGPGHPDTPANVSNLGLVLTNQDKYKEAEVMLRHSLIDSKKGLNPDYPDMLISFDNLDLVLGNQVKYKRAEITF